MCATGKKLMKRSNTAFWLLWAGIPDEAQKNALVAAMFDPQQFYSRSRRRSSPWTT